MSQVEQKIYYNKYKEYIFTIECVDRDEPYDERYIEDDFGVHLDLMDQSDVIEFKIIRIVNLKGDIFNEIDKYKIEQEYCIYDLEDNSETIFYEDFSDAFNHNFIKYKQYELFENGYSGCYKEYHTCLSRNTVLNAKKKLKKEYYHVNGKIEGIYKTYAESGDLIEETNYILGKKNGQSLKWISIKMNPDNYTYIDDKLISYVLYNTKNKIMEELKIIEGQKYCIKYDINGNIIFKHIEKNGKWKRIN